MSLLLSPRGTQCHVQFYQRSFNEACLNPAKFQRRESQKPVDKTLKSKKSVKLAATKEEASVEQVLRSATVQTLGLDFQGCYCYDSNASHVIIYVLCKVSHIEEPRISSHSQYICMFPHHAGLFVAIYLLYVCCVT